MTEIERGLVKTSRGYIHYRAAGSGPVVMAFHINQQSSAMFLELLSVLAPSARGIAIDYPSHGSSDHVIEQPTIHDYAETAIEVLDALGIDTAAVLGEATGSAVAIEAAVSYPNRVNKVILANCPFVTPGAVTDPAVAVVRSSRPDDETGFPMTRLKEFLLEVDPAHAPMHPTQDWMDRLNVSNIEAGRERWQAITALGNYSIPDNVGRITQPVRLLVGEHFYYVRFVEELAKRLANVVGPEIIPGARFCMTWEFADVVGAHTLEFLKD